MSGKGVSQGYQKACIWHSIAAASGEESATDLRDRSSKLLSPTQLAEAQEQVKERLKQIEEREQGRYDRLP